MKLFGFINILLFSLAFISCKESAEVYLGIPLQPDLEENNFEPGLNIIGVIRPDFTDTINNSFVHVQKVAPAINNSSDFTTDSLLVTEADVNISIQNGENFDFVYTTHDSLFYNSEYRPNSSFTPISGNRLSISCSYNNLPVLSSETIIPNKPEIIESSLVNDNSNLYFEIAADTTSFLYEIYVFSENQNIGYSRFISGFTENTLVHVKISKNTFSRIEVYGYDYNLASYYLTSNTSLNFNKYRKTFGNVENGYGVFGSMNSVLYIAN